MSAERLIPLMLNDTSITALIGDRLALERLPTNIEYPAVAYTVISDIPHPNVAYQNGQQLTFARVQINPIALTVAKVVEIHSAIKNLLNFKHNTLFSGIRVMSCRIDPESGKGMFEKDDETGLWTRSVDYFLQYYE